MLRIILVLMVVMLASPATANVLSKTEYFQLYSIIIPRVKIAQRMEQMYDILSPAQKAAAAAMLKQDLQDQINTNLQMYNDMYIVPTTQKQTDVDDTTLP